MVVVGSGPLTTANQQKNAPVAFVLTYYANACIYRLYGNNCLCVPLDGGTFVVCMMCMPGIVFAFLFFLLSVEVSNNLSRAALTFYEKGVLLLEIFALKKRSVVRNRNYPNS